MDRYGIQNDPFADNDAVPLRDYQKSRKHDSQASVAPMIQPAEYDDPFVRDAEPKRSRRRKESKEQGWFKGKITWVCFILSIIQIVVFIYELVRNGKKAASCASFNV